MRRKGGLLGPGFAGAEARRIPAGTRTSITKGSSSSLGRARRVVLQAILPVLLGFIGVLVVSRVIPTGATPSLPQNEGPAPWPLPDRAAERATVIRLPAYHDNGAAEHPHAHLGIFVDGARMPIPPNLGFPHSPLHTHSDSGILHMETSDDTFVFTLRHLFQLWGVRITDSCIGSYCAPHKPTTVFIDGKRHAGPVPAIELRPTATIVLVIGHPPTTIPFAYDCADAPDIERPACQAFLHKGQAS